MGYATTEFVADPKVEPNFHVSRRIILLLLILYYFNLIKHYFIYEMHENEVNMLKILISMFDVL